MKWKEQLLALTPYQPGKSIDDVKKQYQLEKIIKLASNENPFGCSGNVKEQFTKIQDFFERYPSGYAGPLREKLASHLNVAVNQIIFGNGSDEVILMIARALLTPNTNTVMATPTFPQYKHNAIIEGAEIREIPLKDGDHDLQGMLKAIDDHTAVVWLCSPNNPTGTYIKRDHLIEFLKEVPADVVVVLDEAYYEYVTAADYYNSVDLLSEFNNVIILRTFSKIYGLASMRVGYGIGHEKVIRTLEPVREPFNTNTMGQIAAAAALEDQQFVRECKEQNRQGLETFYQFCNEYKLSYYPSQGNFILIDFNVDADEVFQFLLERGFIVRSGKALGFPTSIRVTVGTKEQNEEIINMMKQFLAH